MNNVVDFPLGPQYAGTTRPCAMCGCYTEIFDGDCCDNCDRIINGILTVIGEHGGSDDTSCVLTENVWRYMLANPLLKP